MAILIALGCRPAQTRLSTLRHRRYRFPASVGHRWGQDLGLQPGRSGSYGLLPDYLQGVASLSGCQEVVQRMFGGAQYFDETWALAEHDKR